MSKEVKRYDCELPVFDSDGGVSSETTRMVKASDFEALLAERDALRDELKSLIRGYGNTLDSAYDRIIFLGGQCDPVSVMIENDIHLRSARNTLAALQGEQP
jgi:hypothetical protein